MFWFAPLLILLPSQAFAVGNETLDYSSFIPHSQKGELTLRLLHRVVLYFHLISNKGQPGSTWSPEEVTRTKERIWKILINPKKFVGKSQKPKEHGDCGSDCWKDCDAFDQSRDHPFCTHCDDVICPAKYPKCQCCRGWSVRFEWGKTYFLSKNEDKKHKFCQLIKV